MKVFLHIHHSRNVRARVCLCLRAVPCNVCIHACIYACVCVCDCILDAYNDIERYQRLARYLSEAIKLSEMGIMCSDGTGKVLLPVTRVVMAMTMTISKAMAHVSCRFLSTKFCVSIYRKWANWSVVCVCECV